MQGAEKTPVSHSNAPRVVGKVAVPNYRLSQYFLDLYLYSSLHVLPPPPPAPASEWVSSLSPPCSCAERA